MCKSGKVFSVEKSNLKIRIDIRSIYKRISDEEKVVIFKFIHSAIAREPIFNLATVFGDQKLNWNNTPLIKLYKITGNENLAALLLGYLMMEYLIEADESWGCVKTDITRRDFETNSYFKIEGSSRAA